MLWSGRAGARFGRAIAALQAWTSEPQGQAAPRSLFVINILANDIVFVVHQQ